MCANSLQSSLTPCNPMDHIAHQPSLSMAFSEHKWSGLPCPPLGDLSDPGIKTMSLTSPALAGRLVFFFFFFTNGAPGEGPIRSYGKPQNFGQPNVSVHQNTYLFIGELTKVIHRYQYRLSTGGFQEQNFLFLLDQTLNTPL